MLGKLWSKTEIFFSIAARLLFFLHSILTIQIVQKQSDSSIVLILLIPCSLQIIETIFTVIYRRGKEFRTVSPCIMLYLASIIPAVWYMESSLQHERTLHHVCQNTRTWLQDPAIENADGCMANFHNSVLRPQVRQQILSENPALNQKEDKMQIQELVSKRLNEEKNFGWYHNLYKDDDNIRLAMCENQYQCEFNTTADCFDADNLTEMFKKLNKGDEATTAEMMTTAKSETESNSKLELDVIQNKIAEFDKIGLSKFDSSFLVIIMHQTILFVVVIGRWLLPTSADVTRDELSQLLFGFIGVGADIMEFITESLKETAVKCSEDGLQTLILFFWCLSLLQFILVLTSEDSGGENKSAWMAFWTNPEVWNICITLFIQDGPFLAVRMYIIFGRDVVNPALLFFTTKNSIVLLLDTYRLAVIATSRPASTSSSSGDVESKEKKVTSEREATPEPDSLSGKIRFTQAKIETLENKLEELREELSPDESKEDVVDDDVVEEVNTISEKA